MFSSTGSLISTRVYGGYGAQAGGIVADATHDDPEIGYNGQAGYITDPETNLVLCGHRYYDPAAGRWLNRDPIGYAGGIGLYNYCANNPVMGVDSSGFQIGIPPIDEFAPGLVPLLEECPVIAAVETESNVVGNALGDAIFGEGSAAASGTEGYITGGGTGGGVMWQVNGQGYLSHYINNGGIQGTGQGLFNQMMEQVGPQNINGFLATFQESNLDKINIATLNGNTLNEAVSLTSTAQWGANYGFTNITEVNGYGGLAGEYTHVTSLIIRP